MADFVVNGDMFGRYVKIPTGHSKAMHTYKVVSRIESNAYCESPIMFPATVTLHPKLVPVLNVIHCGIDESQVIRVALADCEIVPAADVAEVKHGRWIFTNKHLWCKDDDGNVDEWKWDAGFHNGPECQVCHATPCVHCTPNWEETECEKGHYYCSECGETSKDAHENYCPNCGAKMDGGAE